MFFLISHKIDDFDEVVVPFLHFFLKFLKGIDLIIYFVNSIISRDLDIIEFSAPGTLGSKQQILCCCLACDRLNIERCAGQLTDQLAAGLASNFGAHRPS